MPEMFLDNVTVHLSLLSRHCRNVVTTEIIIITYFSCSMLQLKFILKLFLLLIMMIYLSGGRKHTLHTNLRSRKIDLTIVLMVRFSPSLLLIQLCVVKVLHA